MTETAIPPTSAPPPSGEDALFREARRLRRRRWAIGTLIGATVLGAVAAILVVTSSGGGATRNAQDVGSAGVLPNGPVATLHLAGALVVGPDGALYVADDPTGATASGTGVVDDRVLVRLRDGRFRVVAGDGTAGFSGDGGPAVRAELSAVSDLAFSTAGTLYLADAGRVRVVGHNGVIHTIAGDGRSRAPQQKIANGTPALSVALGSIESIGASGDPLWIALSPTGQLYISTGQQILRLTAGKLYTVPATVPSGIGKGELRGFGPIAIDAHGNIDVSCGPRGWPIWQVTPNGVAHYVGFARQSGGNCAVVRPGPGRAVYEASGAGIARIESQKLVSIFLFTERLRGQYFPVTYFAFGAHGTLYADDVPGNLGFERHQQLRFVAKHHTALLWQEHNTTSN